jgi:hypothetical protein
MERIKRLDPGLSQRCSAGLDLIIHHFHRLPGAGLSANSGGKFCIVSSLMR